MGLLLRWAVAFLLLAATYNPTQWNFLRWSYEHYDTDTALIVLMGLILMIGYVIYLRTTLRSIDGLGMLMVLAVVLALVWVLVDYGVISLESDHAKTWIGLVAVSAVLGIGLGWSIVRRMLTGQLDIDDVDA